jgi:hypothetical protein
MAKVKIQGHASGTGVLTVTAPNTSTDRTITLPDATGTLLTADGDGSSLTGVGVAGISSSADATAITINSSEQVGIGKTPVNTLDVNHSGGAIVKLWRDSSSGYLQFDTDGTSAHIKNGGGSIKFKTGGDTVRASVTDNGICFGTDTAAANALDHYEEGTWTPTISGSSTCSIGTVHNAHYTRVGNKVTLYSSFRVDSSSDPATGSLIFGGFPFAFKTLGESAFLISVYYNYRECPNAFMTVDGYTYYTNTTVGGNNLGDLTAALDDANTFGMNFTYLTN